MLGYFPEDKHEAVKKLMATPEPENVKDSMVRWLELIGKDLTQDDGVLALEDITMLMAIIARQSWSIFMPRWYEHMEARK